MQVIHWHGLTSFLSPLAMCSLAAAVQGMDETVNNGAQAIYFAEDVRFLSLVVLAYTDFLF